MPLVSSVRSPARPPTYWRNPSPPHAGVRRWAIAVKFQNNPFSARALASEFLATPLGIMAWSADAPSSSNRRTRLARLVNRELLRIEIADTYFLGYLGSPQRGAEKEYTADKVHEAVAYTIKRIKETGNRESVPLIAHNLYVALDEDASPLDRLNQALYPYWKSLWPIAARGHYFEPL